MKTYFKNNINSYIQENNNSISNSSSIGTFSRLLLLFYVLNKQLKLPTKDDELAYLLGSLIYAGKPKIKKTYISMLRHYNRLKELDENADYESMKKELIKVKSVLSETQNLVDTDLNNIKGKINKLKKP